MFGVQKLTRAKQNKDINEKHIWHFVLLFLDPHSRPVFCKQWPEKIPYRIPMIEVAFKIFFVRDFGLSSSFSILSVHPYFLVHMRPRISTGALAARKDYKNRPTVENRRKWSKIVLSWVIMVAVILIKY